jgi:hypothetical protein
MLIVCRKNLSESKCMYCKIMTIEGEEIVFFRREPGSLSMLGNSIEIRWIGLQYAKV